MRILIAEDDAVLRRLLETTLQRWGYEVISVADGTTAWEILIRPDAPKLAILDWMMPGKDGIQICRDARDEENLASLYIIILTVRDRIVDVVTGLQAGANDYITKPFNREELKARVQVGQRVVELQSNLADRISELENALNKLNQLQGLLPICSYCKKVRTDQNYWQQVENYLVDHSNATISHSICPDCYEEHAKPQLEESGEEPNPPRPTG